MRMEELREMLCEELDNISDQGEITTSSLDIIDKLTHAIKSIDTIVAMEEANYSKYDDRRYGRNRHSRRSSLGRYGRNDSDSE